MSGKCRYPRCRFPAHPVELPLTGERTSVCDRHRGAAFLAAMRRLVAHG